MVLFEPNPALVACLTKTPNVNWLREQTQTTGAAAVGFFRGLHDDVGHVYAIEPNGAITALALENAFAETMSTDDGPCRSSPSVPTSTDSRGAPA